ncbi:MAG: caspase family protein, partial [candidate division Zixibacteria bacterium]|nr:caspase family protein [Candidatus Tariuqbacter arcticus]
NCLRTFSGHSGWVNSVAFSADGRYALSGSWDNTLKLWDIQNGNCLRTFSGHSDIVFSVAFSPDGGYALSGSNDKTSKLWDINSGIQIRTFSGHSSKVNSVAFSPDGRYALSGSGDKTLKLWDIQTGNCLRTFREHRKRVSSVAFSPDRRYALSGSWDNNLKLWDINSGKEIRAFRGHSKSVESVAFSPDGRYALSGSEDKTLKLWDIQTGKCLRTFSGHGANILSVAFSPDGRYALSGSDDNTLKLWDITYAIVKGENPKTEFETADEYKQRIASLKKEYITKLELEYQQRLQEQQRKEQEKQLTEQKKEQETQDKIRQSLSEASLQIEQVGNYNADTEIYPITINNNTQNIKIPRSEARAFKENWQTVQVKGMKQLKRDLINYEYFNLTIIHPITGSQYPFGEQRSIEGLAQIPAAATTTKAITPPALTLKNMKFSEPNNNGFLDAEEKGKISVEIANSGQGSAFGVILELKNEVEDPSLTYSKNRIVGEIPPGQTKTVDFDIEANKNIQRLNRSFVISATESNGFNPDPVKLNFETFPLLLPDLTLIDYGISTASGDNIIIPGEVVTILVRIQNRGQGKGKNVNFKANLPANVFFAPGSKENYSFAEFASGDFKDLEFSVLTNPKVGNEVNLTIGMNETNTLNSFPIKLKINKPVRTITEFVVKGKELEKIDFANVATLTIDIEKDIPVSPVKNKNAVALVIAVSDYANPNVPDVAYAKQDAALMRIYLEKTMGYPPEAILPHNPQELMTAAVMKTYIKNKLPAFLKPDGSSDLFVYYTGHGAPKTDSGEPFFVPQDCDPNFVSDISAYRMREFYQDIANLKAKSKTVVVEACFSGQTGDGKTLVKGASPALLIVDDVFKISPGCLLFQSSLSNQVSNWYPEKQHGMFTYFFLKGLKGAADFNKDGVITAGELEQYINDENDGLPYWSNRTWTRPQTAVISGDKERVIVKVK